MNGIEQICFPASVASGKHGNFFAEMKARIGMTAEVD
jgi:hypothetical protein